MFNRKYAVERIRDGYRAPIVNGVSRRAARDSCRWLNWGYMHPTHKVVRVK